MRVLTQRASGTARLGCLLLAAGGLVACTSTDPLYRSGLWRPIGSNEQDLRLMVANPHDLIRGRGDAGGYAATAVAAIQRLRADKVKPLSTSSSQAGPEDTANSSNGS